MRVVIATDRESRQQPLLHLDALALIGLATLDLKEVLRTLMCSQPEVDASSCLHFVAEVPANLIARETRIRRCVTPFQLSNSLRDEFTAQHWHGPCEIERLPNLGMRLHSDDPSYAFVQIPETRREAALIQKATARNKGVVKWRDEAFELLLSRIRHFIQPPLHERP
jgi:hypothetical protein